MPDCKGDHHGKLTNALQAFSNCNPVWLSELEGVLPEAEWRSSVQHQTHWYGFPPVPLPPEFQWHHKGKPLYHIFPAVGCHDEQEVGLMLGLSAAPVTGNGAWRLSDAFGRMGFTTDDAGDPLPAIFDYLESAWRAETGDYLPLRWRNPLDFRLLSPVHMDRIGGESMQVPLLLALLRATAVTYHPDELPWGPAPVFSTGRLGAGGAFEAVEGLEQKLLGFVREFGEGRHAVLTREQQRELSRTPGLLDKVASNTADGMQELLRVPIIHGALRTASGPPAPAEIDRLFQQVTTLRTDRRFDEVSQLAAWLQPHLGSQSHRALTSIWLGQTYAHRGDHVQARGALEVVREATNEDPNTLGIDGHIEHCASEATDSFDAGQPEEGIRILEPLADKIVFCSHKGRAAYWGSMCQLYRASDAYDEAIDAGHKAVDMAIQGSTSEAHRDINYLVHAYITRARAHATHRQEDLKAASQWLSKSKGEYAPVEGNTHIVFCQHLEAECARLERRPFDVPDVPAGPLATWEHAYLFTLLSIARNPAVAFSLKEQALDRLLEKSGEYRKSSQGYSVFHLFDAVYRLYASYTRSEYDRPDTEDFRHELGKLYTSGLQGWKKRLEPHLSRIDECPEYDAEVEMLCDAVYFH